MKQFFINSIIIIIFPFSLWAQENLVPNNSFENYSACPATPGSIVNTTNWYSCNKELADYYNTCQLQPLNYGVPFTANGYQQAKTGIAFAGILVYNDSSITKRSYIQVQLTNPLIAATDYDVSFYVSLSNNSSVAISQLGAYLSSTIVADTSSGALPYIPQVVATGTFLTDTTGWIKISGKYTASGGEHYLTIGNFKDNGATDTLHLSTLPLFSYYFIEDVSIVQSQSYIEVATVFTPNEDGINDDWIIRNLPENSFIKIYDRWGIQVGGVEGTTGIKGTYKWDGRTTSGERCINGVYYYVVSSEADGNYTSKKGFFHLIR